MDESLVMGLDSIKDTISICIFTMTLIYTYIQLFFISFLCFYISYKREMSRLMNYGLLSSFLGKHPMTPLRSRHHPPMLPFYERPPWGLILTMGSFLYSCIYLILVLLLSYTFIILYYFVPRTLSSSIL